MATLECVRSHSRARHGVSCTHSQHPGPDGARLTHARAHCALCTQLHLISRAVRVFIKFRQNIITSSHQNAVADAGAGAGAAASH